MGKIEVISNQQRGNPKEIFNARKNRIPIFLERDACSLIRLWDYAVCDDNANPAGCDRDASD
jgi:hypothetical protein